MDTTLARTFLTVLATGSFATAAEALLVSQSAVSLRIQKLESLIGQRLFDRSKSGVEPTVHGEQFEPYARGLLQIWDEARYQTALPEGFEGSLSLACQDSLWPELSARWVMRLTEQMPNVALRFRILSQGQLVQNLVRGTVDIAVVYTPEIRPGIDVEHIMDDQLVMVSPDKSQTSASWERYVFCDWGAEFAIAHSRWFPDLKPPQLSLAVGTSLPQFLIAQGRAAYMPYRIADDYVARGDLHFVPGTPRFPFPAYAVWGHNRQAHRIDAALSHLRAAARQAPWLALER